MDTRRGKILADQIQQQDKETEVHWLGSEPDSFLALFRADHSGQPFANVLILHDNRQHPDWPGLVNSLRTRLAAHGWNTLAISLPDYIEQPALPPRARAAVGKEVVQSYYAEESEKVLAPVAKFLARHGIEARSSWKAGHAGESIAKLAEDGKFDLLVMGSHGHSALANLVMGSVATQVLAHCKVPVLLVR